MPREPEDDLEDFQHFGPQYYLRATAIQNAVAAERERCAAIAENYPTTFPDESKAIATAIRAVG